MNIQLRRAARTDLPALLPLMRAYYADDALVFMPMNAEAMARLLAASDWGSVWFIEYEGRTAGYVALTLGYSIELGGREAYIDEFYVERALRGRGIARSALALLLDEARALGVCALNLEVDTANERALRLYAGAGFELRARYQLMTKGL